MCNHLMTQLFDGQEFCITCGYEFNVKKEQDEMDDTSSEDSMHDLELSESHPGGYDTRNL